MWLTTHDVCSILISSMIANTREAVNVLVMMDRDEDETKLKQIVEFLRKNPDELPDFCSKVQGASDASNHYTPYRRICLILRTALEEVT